MLCASLCVFVCTAFHIHYELDVRSIVIVSSDIKICSAHSSKAANECHRMQKNWKYGIESSPLFTHAPTEITINVRARVCMTILCLTQSRTTKSKINARRTANRTNSATQIIESEEKKSSLENFHWKRSACFCLVSCTRVRALDSATETAHREQQKNKRKKRARVQKPKIR